MRCAHSQLTILNPWDIYFIHACQDVTSYSTLFFLLILKIRLWLPGVLIFFSGQCWKDSHSSDKEWHRGETQAGSSDIFLHTPKLAPFPLWPGPMHLTWLPAALHLYLYRSRNVVPVPIASPHVCTVTRACPTKNSCGRGAARRNSMGPIVRFRNVAHSEEPQPEPNLESLWL